MWDLFFIGVGIYLLAGLGIWIDGWLFRRRGGAR
jgi:hypothetical protein